jgi:hypothetical protein
MCLSMVVLLYLYRYFHATSFYHQRVNITVSLYSTPPYFSSRPGTLRVMSIVTSPNC